MSLILALRILGKLVRHANKYLGEYNEQCRLLHIEQQMAQDHLTFTSPKGLMWTPEERHQVAKCSCGCREAVLNATARAKEIRGT